MTSSLRYSIRYHDDDGSETSHKSDLQYLKLQHNIITPTCFINLSNLDKQDIMKKAISCGCHAVLFFQNSKVVISLSYAVLSILINHFMSALIRPKIVC